MVKVKKIVKGFVLGLILSISLLLIGLNVMKFVIYSEYYSLEEDICINPGLNDGLVPQGIAVSDSEDLILTSGYMKNKNASRVYITNSKNESHYVELYEGEKASTRHFGGIALSGDTVYLATSSKIFPVKLDVVKNSTKLDIGEGITVNNNASYIYANDDYLYVGEFHMNDSYQTDNHLEVNGKTYDAICEVYTLDDFTKPVCVYAIRDKVQGFAITDKGTIVLSTS